MREQLIIDQQQKYDMSTIRCHCLPPNDSHVFEFTIKSSSQFSLIHAQIQSLFSTDITLFTLTPQKTHLPLDKSVFDLNLYPRGKIYCEASSPLSTEYINRYYSKPAEVTIQERPFKRENSRNTEPLQFSTPKTKPTDSPERKVPKWFKP